MSMHKWLIFLPQTPTTPSSLRVSVWRRMQQCGAVPLQNGVWILPYSNVLEHKLHVLLADLETQGGSGLLFITQTAHADLDEQIIERFRFEREQDYSEFLERCKMFLCELEKETSAQKFTFAELEENEEDLRKLERWLRKIYRRDFFGGPHRDLATAALTRCHSSLGEFATQTYLQNGCNPPLPYL